MQSLCEISLKNFYFVLHQEAITDGLEIVVSPRSLHSELMCPICLDMLKNTMTTKECLHRFCADCIITALRSGYGNSRTGKRDFPSDENVILWALSAAVSEDGHHCSVHNEFTVPVEILMSD